LQPTDAEASQQDDTPSTLLPLVLRLTGEEEGNVPALKWRREEGKCRSCVQPGLNCCSHLLASREAHRFFVQRERLCFRRTTIRSFSISRRRLTTAALSSRLMAFLSKAWADVCRRTRHRGGINAFPRQHHHCLLRMTSYPTTIPSSPTTLYSTTSATRRKIDCVQAFYRYELVRLRHFQINLRGSCHFMHPAGLTGTRA
jgi:hypothetical protein